MPADEEDPIDRINRIAYADEQWAEDFARADGLVPGETVIFNQIKDEVRGGKILDLGVGGGRTTGPLLEISRDYIGVDSSLAMVAASRKRYPGVEFLAGDASDMAGFTDSQFDLAVFSFNGLDYAGHERRMRILREISRVLKPGGYFVFSSHNRDLDRYDVFKWPIPPWDWNPLRSAGNFRTFAARLLRHWRLSPFEVRRPGYAILNEPEHGYALMTYYVAMAEQARQLREAGFGGPVRAYDSRGQETTENHTDRAVHYCAKK